MPKIDWLFFDLGGVLLDDNGIEEARNQIRQIVEVVVHEGVESIPNPREV